MDKKLPSLLSLFSLADDPLRTLLPPQPGEPPTLAFIKAQPLMRIDYMIQSPDSFHRDVSKSRTWKRQIELERHNKRTGIRHANVYVGDFGLVADRQSHSGSKLAVKWKGSRRFTRCDSQLVFEVEDLLNETRSLVLANRLRFFEDSQPAVTETLLDTIDHNETNYNTVIKLLEIEIQPIL